MASYAVPLFLLINGYLVIHKEYSLEQYVKKAGHIIIITFLWGIVYNLVFGIVFHEENAGIDIIRRIYQGGGIPRRVHKYKKLVFLDAGYYIHFPSVYKCDI